MAAKRGCYLFHFDQPISDGHPTQHYLGWASDIDARETEHRAGRGARLTQVAIERGIGFTRVRVWEGYSRTDERRLKNANNSPRYCPICQAERAAPRPGRRPTNENQQGAGRHAPHDRPQRRRLHSHRGAARPRK